MTRQRGVLVYPVPPEVHPDAPLQRFAVGVNPYTDETYLIHTEGVTFYVGHDRPFRFNDYNLTSPFHLVCEVRGWMHGPEPVDLADWVREHNDRLESNFRQAYWVLTSMDPREDEDGSHRFDSNYIRGEIAKFAPAR